MKYCQLLVLILATNLVLAHQHTYKCLFDQTNVDLKQASSREKPDIPVHPQSVVTEGRLLQTPSPVRSTFRIELDTTYFLGAIQAGQNGASTTTTARLDFILKSMAVTQIFYQSRLQVGQLASISSPATCVDFAPPSQSFASVDLVIYVRYITDAGLGYGATGKSCKYYSANTLPDMQLMQGRPTVGRIIFNTYNLVDLQSTLTNKVFQSLTSTALHETMHILGFDSTLYSTYLDPTTGNPYAYAPEIVGTVNSNRPATKFMTTPYVLAWAKAFFGCNTMTGMPLENEDGTGAGSASHWERTAMYDELMTGTALGTAKYFSGLTFALLKDSGWYAVDDTFAGTSNFGYQKGCTFVTQACYGTSFTQFCTLASFPSTNSYCDSNFIGKAICSTAAGLMADGCGMFGQHSSCIDANTQPGSYDIYTYDAYGYNSFCVDSTFGSIVADSKLRSRCYPYVCNPTNITFTIGTYTVTCLDTEAGVQKTLSALAGYLTCPVFTSFCTVSYKTCSKFCNQNGYCMGGVCHCNTGFFGSDCSKSTCTAGQYYNPVGGTCGTTCNTGYYINKFSKSCEPCQSPCSECSGTPTNCVGCQPVNGVTMYFYAGNCYAACPTSTYPLANLTCANCDTTACLNCSGSPTTCTACHPSFFLYTSNSSCSATCVNPFALKDEVNNKCVNTCPSNLFTYTSNSTCNYCGPNTYLQASACVGTCTTGYYPDATLKACMICHGQCLTCDGSYPQNCTSCKPTSGNPYLLLKMCWAICPKGFYANPSTYKCQVCPVQKKCTACKYNSSNSSAYCTSCEYGTFYHSSTLLCQTGCDANQYKNTWNNSCNGCDLGCATCNGPTSFSCTSCSPTSYLLTNSTGGYCLTSCPTQGYIRIGTTCQTCDPTCKTCNGVAANQCADCATNYYFYSGYCRYVCPNGTYADSTVWQCLGCDATCSYCFASGNSSCTSCATGLYLYNFTCSNSCPSGMTPNQWNVCWEPSLLTSVILMILVLLMVV